MYEGVWAMAYEEDNKDLDEDVGIDADVDIEEGLTFPEEEGELEEAIPDDLEQPRKSKARQSNFHTLSARRAIEDHFEREKLRKELDYLFDDGFGEELKEEGGQEEQP